MNLTIKSINNCNNLEDNKLKNLASKYNVKISDEENINDNRKNQICNEIIRRANERNPCAIPLYKDTDLSLKKHQISASNILVKQRGLILVHSVGTGKTLSAISAAQCLFLKKKIEHIIVVTPTSLQKNFIQQAMQYGLSEKDIDDNYTFYTIQGMSNAIENKQAVNPSNSLLIIDEAHNLRTIGGTRFVSILKYAKKAEKVMLLTATPLINYSHDIINLVSLVSGEKPISIDKFDTMVYSKDKSDFKEYINGWFDFYIKKKDDDPNFPSKKMFEIFLPMEKDYLKTYLNIEKGQVSKIPDFKDKNIHVFYNGLRRASNILDEKSHKVDWIIKLIKSNKKSKFVIFSHFINMGIVPVMKWLDKHNIKYANVTGDMSIEDRHDAVKQYNNDEIKILFISKAGSEGLDLKNTNFIIIMESAWNENSVEQIIGRGVRYKSHENLPKSQRNVTIYRLYSVKPEEYKDIKKITKNNMLEFNDNMLSVDLYLRNFSLLKQNELNDFQKLLLKYSSL
jgi:superfamily II DNA or RNA helicase